MNKNKVKNEFAPLHRKGVIRFFFATALLVISSFITFGSASSDNDLQQKKITGRITNTNGEALPGVTVVVKGTSSGVVSDAMGRYSIEIPAGANTIVFSYIGVETREVLVGNQTTIDVVLDESTVTLESVVVIGYGTMKRQDITGAVSSVKATDIIKTPVSVISKALQGKVAGVDISAKAGDPGSAVKIRIRGNRSITAGNDPLIVVDGIPFLGNINDINPGDINSIEILKDASATAIYGSRGSNGVIIVTTKRGIKNTTAINFTSYYGFVDMVGEIIPRNTAGFIQQRKDLNAFYGLSTDDAVVFKPWELQAIADGIDTDWMSYQFRKGYQQNYQLTMSGGNEKTQYLISGGMYNEKAIIHKGDYSRYSFRMNLDHQVYKWLKVGTSTSIGYSIRNNGVYEPIRSIQIGPLAQPYDENGKLYVTTSPMKENTLNPILKQMGDSRDEDRWLQLNPNFYTDINITKDLKYRLNLATSFKFNRSGTYQSSIYNAGGFSNANISSDQNLNVLAENILSFDKTIGLHNLKATGLYSFEKNRFESMGSRGQDLPYETQLFFNIGSVNTIQGISSSLSNWALMSLMGRIQYSFDNKYLLTATIRADGSSRLADGNKWGFFPSAAVSWRISEEPFLENAVFIEDLKIRASFGRVGNTAISPYQTQGSATRASYNFGSTNSFGYYTNNLANPDLGWEMTNTFNIGIDYNLFNGRINGAIELYRQYTSDLILTRQLPYTTGFDNVLQNVGKTRNTGFEFTLIAQPLSSVSKSLEWSTELTLGYNKEEIMELYNGPVSDPGSGWFIGEPVNAWYYYKAIGIWKTEEAADALIYNQKPGSVKLLDADMNNKIDANDRVIQGSPTPRFSIGWDNTFSFRGVDLSVFTYARLGQTIVNRYYQQMFLNSFAHDIHCSLDFKYWTPENQVNTFPSVSKYDLNDYPQSLAYRDGSFFKIKNISLGYTLNKAILKDLPIQKIRLYGTAYNMFTFNKKMEGVTLDIETSDGYVGTGTPLTRSFVFGLDITF